MTLKFIYNFCNILSILQYDIVKNEYNYDTCFPIYNIYFIIY